MDAGQCRPLLFSHFGNATNFQAFAILQSRLELRQLLPSGRKNVDLGDGSYVYDHSNWQYIPLIYCVFLSLLAASSLHFQAENSEHRFARNKSAQGRIHLSSSIEDTESSPGETSIWRREKGQIPSLKLTAKAPKMMVSNRSILFQWFIIQVNQVTFREGNLEIMVKLKGNTYSVTSWMFQVLPLGDLFVCFK